MNSALWWVDQIMNPAFALWMGLFMGTLSAFVMDLACMCSRILGLELFSHSVVQHTSWRAFKSGEITMEDALHDKYEVTKRDGTPTDPDAVYFVLRIDNDEDALLAAMMWAMRKNMPGLYEDLRKHSKVNNDTSQE
jgi:hypothetical protein